MHLPPMHRMKARNKLSRSERIAERRAIKIEATKKARTKYKAVEDLKSEHYRKARYSAMMEELRSKWEELVAQIKERFKAADLGIDVKLNDNEFHHEGPTMEIRDDEIQENLNGLAEMIDCGEISRKAYRKLSYKFKSLPR